MLNGYQGKVYTVDARKISVQALGKYFPNSPMLAAAVAVSGVMKKDAFISERKGILNPAALDKEEYRELLKKQPAYGNIICRCEMVSEGEILDAIHRPLGARSLDGVKRRTRAGMGRCQSGFCSPKTMEILARELGKDMAEITKCGKNSQIILGINKDTF